jgi:Na+/proline symporter
MFKAVVFLYFVIAIAVGVYLSKRVKKASDFLVAGRQLGLPLTTATLAAIQLGAGVILGGSELGAGSGVHLLVSFEFLMFVRRSKPNERIKEETKDIRLCCLF